MMTRGPNWYESQRARQIACVDRAIAGVECETSLYLRQEASRLQLHAQRLRLEAKWVRSTAPPDRPSAFGAG